MAGWIALAAVILVIMPGHVWWYKHKDRPLLSAWLMAIPVYLLTLIPVFILLRYWKPFTDTLGISQEYRQVAWLIGIGLAILIANVIWINFLRFLKRPPTVQAKLFDKH